LLDRRRLMLGEQFQQTLAAFVIHHCLLLMPSVFVKRPDDVGPRAASCGKKSNEELTLSQSLNDQTIDYLAAARPPNARFDQPND
jgi:hypothetical protein